MQLEKEFPARTTASILYFNSDGQVAQEGYCIPSIHFGTQGAHGTGNETDAF